MNTIAASETTRDLLAKIRGGDAQARERLVARYLPILTRWAHGRLPGAARDINETADLVQTALLRACTNLPAFQAQGEGAFFGYLRQAISNLLKDESRHLGRRPFHDALSEELVERGPTPTANALTLETMEAYQHALRQLDDEQRELVVLRVEFGLDNDEIAALTGSPSTNAARMRLARALARLGELMSGTGSGDREGGDTGRVPGHSIRRDDDPASAR